MNVFRRKTQQRQEIYKIIINRYIRNTISISNVKYEPNKYFVPYLNIINLRLANWNCIFHKIVSE